MKLQRAFMIEKMAAWASNAFWLTARIWLVVLIGTDALVRSALLVNIYSRIVLQNHYARSAQ